MRKIILTLLCLLYFPTVFAAANDVEKLKEDYNRSYAVVMAAASCLGVYTPDTSVEFSYLHDYGWHIVPQNIIENNKEAHFSVAHNYLREENKKLYLFTFRGSASKKDWQINLKTGQVPFVKQKVLADGDTDKIPMVHEGFSQYTDLVLKNTVLDADGRWTDLFQKIADDENSYVILTGHSLGGAVATLLGERLAELGLPKERFMVVTFGAPAVGNEAFAKIYGDKIDLLRITNTADPVPGSLQTFFGGYKQFGRQYKYHLSPKISDFQHDMALYFDYSVNEYYKMLDAAAAQGIAQLLPNKKLQSGQPLVAVWIYNAPGLQKMPYIADVKRFVEDEYKSSLPAYVLMQRDLSSTEVRQDLLKLSKMAGAEYILLCGIDGDRPQNARYWYLTLRQTLLDKDGNLLCMESFGQKVDPAAGTIQAAGSSFLKARKSLAVYLQQLITARKNSWIY